MAQAASEILHIEQEMALHLGYCASFGLSKSDVESHKPSQGEYDALIRKGLPPSQIAYKTRF